MCIRKVFCCGNWVKADSILKQLPLIFNLLGLQLCIILAQFSRFTGGNSDVVSSFLSMSAVLAAMMQDNEM